MPLLRKRISTLIFFPILAVCALAYFILNLAQSNDEQISKERTRFFRAIVNNEKDNSANLAREYSLWSESIEKSIQSPDPEWLKKNIGQYLLDSYDYQATLVLSPENKTVLRFDNDPAIPSKLTDQKPLLDLAERVRAFSPKDYNSLSDWVNIDGTLYLVGAGAFTYEESYAEGKTERSPIEYHVFMTFKKADQEYWSDMSEKFNLPEVSLSANQEGFIKTDILNSQGDSVGQIYFKAQPHLFLEILTQYGGAIIVLTIILTFIAIYSIRRSIAYQKANDDLVKLNQRMDELVKERTLELTDALERTEKANAAKSIFLSAMSHEFRTPLNGILGFTQLLNSSARIDALEKEKRWLEQIEKAGGLLLDLVNDVLDMAYVESGKISLEESVFQPREVFRQCYDIIQPMAEQKEITLKGIPKTDKCVKVDKRRLQQVLLNLMNNAIKYNNPGGHIHFGCEELDEVTMRLFVKDTGIGISEEEQEKIFAPFYRSPSKTSVEGTGIGLALVVRLTEAMGGKVSVESELGKGSSFYLDFPIHEMPNS